MVRLTCFLGDVRGRIGMWSPRVAWWWLSELQDRRCTLMVKPVNRSNSGFAMGGVPASIFDRLSGPSWAP